MVKIKKLCFLILFVSALIFPESTIIKNATVYLPNQIYQAESFIILNGCKIEKIGLMKSLDDGVYLNEYDVNGGFVYPGFIDPYYSGFQAKKAADKKQTGGGSRPPALDKTKRPPYKERNLFITRKIVDNLALKKSTMRKMVSNGFCMAHIVPDTGIIGGTGCVISLVSDQSMKAVIKPESFMSVGFKPNSTAYPSTLASVMTELFQLKEDTRYFQKMKTQQFYHPSQRLHYQPEFEILQPFFSGGDRFLFKTKNLVEQRMVELVKRELKINPVLVVHTDVWRRKVEPGTDIILPLKFKPPSASKYAQMGKKMKNEAEKEIYPKKLAEFIKSTGNVSLAAPDLGDYKTLFKNIREVMKNGVSEADVIKTLTLNPAGLLGVSKFAGSIEEGKLANLIVSDKKIFEEKAKIKMAFVEGNVFDFKKREGDLKPPVTDITGTWNAKVESPMGNFELKMVVEQDENDITGKLTSTMGTMEIDEGLISGDEISFTLSLSMAGQDVTLEVTGKVKDKRITGTMTMGSYGEGTFVATPEQGAGGLK